MYQTEIESCCDSRSIITARMDEQGRDITIRVREIVDNIVMEEAQTEISIEGFFDLVYPILHAKGYRLSLNPEVN